MARKCKPYPYPRCENDHTFNGIKECQKHPFETPIHLAQNENPWSRLNDTATLASVRRNVCYYDQEAPSDSLDFQLKSTYDHHQEFLCNKNKTLFQRETYSDEHGRILKNREKAEAPQCEVEKRDIRVWVNPQKASIYSIQGTIESHHNASTNRGYSRKHDGGFYST
ncbi:protein C1orf194 homolog [Clupea harengus]|uniref:Protein C1orf194 homolog n=1 Tax=Clupea harengus TaxID=7950 RepID=A0A6P8FBU6_CLUHA|nr:protein C1orf194 homolog [Clupea harengus]